jgi:hypothetical protein
MLPISIHSAEFSFPIFSYLFYVSFPPLQFRPPIISSHFQVFPILLLMSIPFQFLNQLFLFLLLAAQSMINTFCFPLLLRLFFRFNFFCSLPLFPIEPQVFLLFPSRLLTHLLMTSSLIDILLHWLIFRVLSPDFYAIFLVL